MMLLLQIGLTNAVTVAVLAVFVLATTRLSRRPQLAHALWVLLLLKLVTPPMISISVESWLSSGVAALGPVRAPAISASAGIVRAAATKLPKDLTNGAEGETTAVAFPTETSTFRETAVVATPFDWRWPLLFVWVSGSLFVAATGIVRIRRFALRVADTEMANPEIQRDAAELTHRLGLARVPDVRVVRGAIPPVVWGAARRPIILLPANLFDRLDRAACRTILAHELAHVRRRDHWIRWLEALVVVLYWWNPVVWLIRRELNRVEELCCDAWVVWLIPENQRAYAGALVETVEFLSASNAMLPAVASGIGRSFPLKTRVAAILATPRAHRLPWPAQATILIVAAIGLPLSAVPGVGIEVPTSADTGRSPVVAFAGTNENADRGAAPAQANEAAIKEIDLDDVGEDELVGQVADSEGKPIEGVEVDAWTWYPGNETRTDTQGRFRLKNLGRREFIEVQFSKANYSPRLFIRQQTGLRDWEITMTDQTFFEGQVTGPDGKPVADALLRANRGPKRMEGGIINDLWTEIRTGQDGRYRLYVEADNYDFQVRVPGVGVARLKATISENETKSLDVALARGVAFRAKIVDSLTGKPVEGVRLWHWQHRGIEGRSNADGTVVINDMFPGLFAFHIEVRGFARWWSQQAASEWNRLYSENENRNWQRNFDDIDFQLEPGMDVVTISIEKEVTIKGRVLDPDGKPVAGATVAPALTGTGNSVTGDTRFSVETNKEGRYEMHLPASGVREYNLMAHDGKYEQWRNWANGVASPIQTNPGATIDDLDIKLTRPATVRGRVVDAGGKPVARRKVRASAADLLENRYYDPTTESDEFGKFELKFVRPDQQYIQVFPFWLTATDAPSQTTHYVNLTEGQIENDVELVAQPDR